MLTLILVLSVLGNQVFPVISGSVADPSADAHPAYIQAFSSENQLQSGDVKFDSPPDGANDIDIEDETNIAIHRDGGYFALVAAQIGSPNRNGAGTVHLWQKMDGVDVPNSNSIQSVERGSSSVLVFPTLFGANSSQNLSFGFSSNPSSECGTLGLIASEPADEPDIPSVIVSVIQVAPTTARNVPAAFLSSSVSQFLTPGTPGPVLLNTISIASQVGAVRAGTKGYVTLTKRGVYFVIASGQVGARNGTGASGEVHQWLKLNGADVPNSNAIQTITQGSTAVLITQGTVKSNGMDRLQTQFSSTDANVGLIASTPEGEPAAPSLIFVVFRISALTGGSHAQLSSSESQWGCLTPRPVTLNNDDDIEGITNSNGNITLNEDGTYFVMASVQVGSEDGTGVGDVHLWMTLNGEPVPNSNALQSVIGDSSVLVVQTAFEAAAEDVLQWYFSTDVTQGTLGLVATAPVGEPAVPSAIVTIFKSEAVNLAAS